MADGLRSHTLVLAFLIAAWALPASVHAQARWQEGFDGSEPSWRPAGSDVRYRLVAHRRTTKGAHSGAGCEQISLEAGNGNYIHFAHIIEPALVIEELQPSMWIFCDRSGIQFSARVVLPRVIDPKTQKGMTAIVGGAAYTQVGRWQKLELTGLPKLLEQRIGTMQFDLGKQLDTREAYVDAVLLNLHAGSGPTNVFTDDLLIAGHARRTEGNVEQNPQPEPYSPGVTAASHVEIKGSTLLADNRPLFPRMIEHQGEPFSFLQKLGFNTIRLKATATPDQLEEAGRLGLWLVCPPPALSALAGGGPASAPIIRYDRVLAWDLGSQWTSADLTKIRAQADELRRADAEARRPLVCSAKSGVRSISRVVDVMWAERNPIGGTLELVDYAEWLRKRSRLARPGTPIWSVVQTQPEPEVIDQFRRFGFPRPENDWIGPEPLRLMTYTLMTTGTRGLAFASSTRLDAGDAATIDRAAALELLNLELQLIEPWANSGNFIGTFPTSDKDISAVAMQTDRAELVVLLWTGKQSQVVPGHSTTGEFDFIVPGMSNSYDAYELSPGGMRPIVHRRVTGGLRATVQDFCSTGLVLISQDPTVVRYVADRLRQIGRRAAELQVQLVERRYAEVQEMARWLSENSRFMPNAPAMLQTAQSELEQARRSLTNGDAQEAYLHGKRSLRPMALVTRDHWRRAVPDLSSVAASPLLTRADTLPAAEQFLTMLRHSGKSGNILLGGSFESLAELQQNGWQNLQVVPQNLNVGVELIPTARHDGKNGIRLRATIKPGTLMPEVLDSPPVSIVSPEVKVEEGALLRITGWVQVPEMIKASVDGLVLQDSIGGEALAERFKQTGGWKPFTLYRVANGKPVKVTCTLTGVGVANIDDLRIEPVAIGAGERDAAVPLPTSSTPPPTKRFPTQPR